MHFPEVSVRIKFRKVEKGQIDYLGCLTYFCVKN